MVERYWPSVEKVNQDCVRACVYVCVCVWGGGKGGRLQRSLCSKHCTAATKGSPPMDGADGNAPSSPFLSTAAFPYQPAQSARR